MTELNIFLAILTAIISPIIGFVYDYATIPRSYVIIGSFICLAISFGLMTKFSNDALNSNYT